VKTRTQLYRLVFDAPNIAESADQVKNKLATFEQPIKTAATKRDPTLSRKNGFRRLFAKTLGQDTDPRHRFVLAQSLGGARHLRRNKD
jgi:hypothetical protein